MRSVCHRYICILIYMKLLQCSYVAEMYDQLEEGVSVPWVYVHFAIYETNAV